MLEGGVEVLNAAKRVANIVFLPLPSVGTFEKDFRCSTENSCAAPKELPKHRVVAFTALNVDLAPRHSLPREELEEEEEEEEEEEDEEARAAALAAELSPPIPIPMPPPQRLPSALATRTLLLPPRDNIALLFLFLFF